VSSTRAPDFFAQARSRFRFLEDKYGFELAAAERGDWREELRYRNATTVVVVARDREYGNRVEVELGALPRGGAAPPERLIVLPALVEVRAESPLAARRAERSLRGLEAELDHWATALARHAEDVLRGDLSVVAEIESRQEARYELITRVYLALSRRGLDEPAPKGAPEEEGVRWSMPAAEIAEALTERELDGRELSKPAVREIVARSVREWLPLRRRLRPGTRRGIDEAAA
jgi:hypothetical protein